LAFSSLQWNMFKTYFIVTWRNLTRHKLYSAINIIGLATGMAACIVILLSLMAIKAAANNPVKSLRTE
jgi:ABC-type antimicrobial peptide transport system permease subunit